MSDEKLRVVFDCNIFWRAFFSPLGIGRKCLELIEARLIEHFTSKEIIREIRTVLLDPKTWMRFGEASPEKVERFIGGMVKKSILVRSVPRRFDLYRDPKDAPYLDLAFETNADYLVTTDRDLLDLMTGTDVECKQFRQQLRHLRIVKPHEFLELMEASKMTLEP